MEMFELNILLDQAEASYTESGASMELDESFEDHLEKAYERIESVYQLSLIEF